MAAPSNADLMKALSGVATPFTVNDNLNASFATAANAQIVGLCARGEILRVVQSVATGAVVLPSLTLDEAGGGPVFVINDSPNSINVGASANDKMNGTATTSSFGAGVIAVPAGTWAIFVPSDSPLGVGGVATVTPNNWHSAVGT